MRYEVRPGELARIWFSESEIAEASGRRLWAVRQQMVAIARRAKRGQRVHTLWARMFNGADMRRIMHVELA